jgi:hypothetical protein
VAVGKLRFASQSTFTPPAWTNAPSGATHPATVPATLPARLYRLINPLSHPPRSNNTQNRDACRRQGADVITGFARLDAGLGDIRPDAGDTTTRTFTDPASPQRFFEIEAVKPLSR